MGDATAKTDTDTTWARVACDRCGVVRVRTADLVLRVCVDDGTAGVRFTCPGCARIDLQPVADAVSTSLVAADVATEWWQRPAELAEGRNGLPFSEDDAAAWQALLADDDALAVALAS